MKIMETLGSKIRADFNKAQHLLRSISNNFNPLQISNHEKTIFCFFAYLLKINGFRTSKGGNQESCIRRSRHKRHCILWRNTGNGVTKANEQY